MRDDRADLQNYAIHGNDGTIYADGAGYLLCATAGESARRWGFIKKRLAFLPRDAGWRRRRLPAS